MTKLTALLLLCLTTREAFSTEPVPFSINTKKFSHVLDDHFISITVNPTDLLQGKVYGLAMNSTMAILKGLAPAYVRIGSPDTVKYTFKRNRYPSDMVKPEDEYTVTETHWMVFNEVAQSAGLDVIVCLNPAHRTEGTKKWDTRNSLELISFSDSQGYNLTWQLGYEVQGGDELSGIQFGKDLNRLRTILNAFPRYQSSKLIGPDIRVIHKKEDIDFWNDVLYEAGPILDAVTWHPRWPQPSKMKVSENSELGYEFPIDHLEWDRTQLGKILQKNVFKNAIWIGESKRESTGTFAEGLMWARRLILAAKLGVEVVMKQPNLMDVSHPKPEYWIALLHKRLLGKSVLETRSVTNHTDLFVISHCTNPIYWIDKPEKLHDGAITVFGVNMGGLEQKVQIKGTTWTGRSQLLFQYVLTSGSDPDSVFSQMTYLNGEPLMMTDDGLLPDIIPRVKKLERGLTMKLPPYSIGFWVVPEAKVKICQTQPSSTSAINIETLTPSKSAQKNLENIQNINQFLVEKLMNPEGESQETTPEMKIEASSAESSEKELNMKENALPRVARRIRQVKDMGEINDEFKTIMEETQDLLTKPEKIQKLNMKLPKATPTMEHRIQSLADGISRAIKTTNQEREFDKFLVDSGLGTDFGTLLMNERKYTAPGAQDFQTFREDLNRDETQQKTRRRRSLTEGPSPKDTTDLKFANKITLVDENEEENKNRKPDLVIPHQPDLKGLEERYKFIVQSTIEDGKRKIDNIKRKVKQEEDEINRKIKSPETVSDIQEEIIKKEIELLEKTEETVADIFKTQKKRQETFEDIIFDELNDVKGEKKAILKEMHKNPKTKENKIVKRQTQAPLSRPLLKTVEYIEKNFNLEPESVRKIKRSLEEKMGEILRNYDTKKSMETKKRFAPSREEKKIITRKSIREDEREANEYSSDDDKVEKTSTATTRSKLKERTIPRRSSLNSSKTGKSSKITTKTEEVPTKKEEVEEEEGDSFEFFNEKKPIQIIKKPERKHSSHDNREEKVSRSVRKESRSTVKDDTKIHKTVKENADTESNKKRKPIVEESQEKKIEEVEDKPEETEPEEKPVKLIPLKNDKERRENMLKQISSMVENMNSLERGSQRSKRRNVDEDISEEFDLDRRSRRIHRRPRKAEVSDFQIQGANHQSVDEGKEELDVFQEAQPTPTPTTPPSKLSKLRKVRVRPTRKPKPSLLKEDEEPQQRKRHLAGFEKPLLDLEKKKLLKPKLRKFSPKLLRHGNELPLKEKPTEVLSEPETVVDTATPEPVPSPIPQQPNEELLKDLQHIAEEELFLGRDSEILNEMPDSSGKKSSEGEDTVGTNISGETPAPTEGYIVVEPTIETDDDEDDNGSVTEKLQTNEDEALIQVGFFPQTKESEEVENDKKTRETEPSKPEEGQTNPLQKQTESEKVKSVSPDLVQDTMEETSPEVTPKDTLPSETQKSKNDKRKEGKVKKPPPTADKLSEEQTEENFSMEIEDPNNSKTQRKRRATFLTAHRDEDDDEDYSSEERIEKFKQMIYKKSPTKRPSKNEVRPSGGGGGGMGADEFLRMAGSTVRVMFDDVIPEAYGQTKTKIQNMGISEYIKEFGKIVQQMKNLDQIFLNIGEAAVKGYIKGNKAEKGPYIQVISRKRRQVDDETFDNYQRYHLPEPESTTDAQPSPKSDWTIDPSDGKIESTVYEATPLTSVSSMFQITARPDSELKPTDTQRHEEDDFVGKTYARTSPTTEEITSDKRGYGWSSDILGQGVGKDIPGKTEKKTWKTEKESKAPMEKIPLTTEYPVKFSGEKMVPARESSLPVNNQPQMKKNYITDYPIVVKDATPSKTSQVSGDLQDTISPWIKTTKDFIKQALTTLKRQKELSEILARETINEGTRFLGKREADDNHDPQLPVYFMTSPEGDVAPVLVDAKTPPKLTKREAEEASLPVYHMTKPSFSKKREALNKRKDESLIRHLRGLQPGVYVVPTEDMTNIRSEQITNEAKQKSGMPNVVTLNIYYDKKKESAGKDETTDKTSELKIQQEPVTYYQNKVWNTAADYDPSTQYLSTFPEVNLPPPIITPVQVTPELQTSQIYTPRLTDLPNSRLIQYGPPTYHYSPVQKVYPSVVSRNSQPYYGPVMYLPQENRFIPQPPGTKRQWNEFKARGVPSLSSGWNLQYDTVPGSLKSSLKNSLSSYNKNFKLFSDKKRSIAGSKMDPTFSESALPFWKFFATSSSEKIDEEPEPQQKLDTDASAETESSEDLFAENRKRTKQVEGKKNDIDSVETVTEDKEPEVVNDRRKRSLTDNTKNDLLTVEEGKKLTKRSYPYDVEFRDHDILPEWFGTYQEIGNSLDELPPHVRRSQIISTPWSDEDELLSILEADDELSLADLADDDDYYYSNDNTIERLGRYPRSTDQSESSMLKTNMIYKMPMDNDLVKHKVSAKTGMKSLTNEDSSLELVTKSKVDEVRTTREDKKPEVVESQQQSQRQPQQQQGPTQQPSNAQITTHGPMLSPNEYQPSLNQTGMKPRNPNDDTFYYFFKYAYDSLVKVMKSMTELF